MCGYGLDRGVSGYGQAGCAVMVCIEMAEFTDRWDVWLWNGSSWLRVGTVGCEVMDWIVLAQYTDRWDVQLWTGSIWLRLRTGGMCGYGLNRAG